MQLLKLTVGVVAICAAKQLVLASIIPHGEVEKIQEPVFEKRILDASMEIVSWKQELGDTSLSNSVAFIAKCGQKLANMGGGIDVAGADILSSNSADCRLLENDQT
ncbi:uncharacterized protein VTP21DRAFT_733 [Calcarisporiella thermophila]|uniref:uncharacterized protein n=1 Tax=Calcarisporiella thermophila TaxID=911321 RepID=UPI003741E8D2